MPVLSPEMCADRWYFDSIRQKTYQIFLWICQTSWEKPARTQYIKCDRLGNTSGLHYFEILSGSSIPKIVLRKQGVLKLGLLCHCPQKQKMELSIGIPQFQSKLSF